MERLPQNAVVFSDDKSYSQRSLIFNNCDWERLICVYSEPFVVRIEKHIQVSFRHNVRVVAYVLTEEWERHKSRITYSKESNFWVYDGKIIFFPDSKFSIADTHNRSLLNNFEKKLQK